MATVEGGDELPVGNKTVLLGMSERTSRRGISQLAAALFERGAAERVADAAMPKPRAEMHLDTVFTFADRDCVPLYPEIVNGIEASAYGPFDQPGGGELRKEDKPFVDVVAEALNLPKLQVVGTGGNGYVPGTHPLGQRRAPGVCVAGRGLRLRPQHVDQHAAAQGGHRSRHDRRQRVRPRTWRRPLHDLPNHPRRRRPLTRPPVAPTPVRWRSGRSTAR